jgi:hypothetical protein
MNGQLGRACTKHMPRRRRVRRILRRTQVLLLSNMRRISRPHVKGARQRVLLDRNLQRHRKDRPSHLEEAGGRMEAADPMAAAGDLRQDSVAAVARMAAAVGRRPESAAVDRRVAVGADRMAVVAAGATVMARAD